jgi:putative hydrolase of the HAD superfamily
MKQTTQIELVTFDLDNTLWDVSQTIVRAEQSLRQWMQENTADALTVYTSDAIGDIRERVLEQHSDKRHDLSFLRTQVLYECMLASGLASKDAVNAASQGIRRVFCRS